MPLPRLGRVDDARATTGFDSICAELKLELQPAAAATAEARQRRDSGPLPAERADRRDLPLLSLDPEGSGDLDQAFLLERNGSGYLIHYSIADLSAWVVPGGAIDSDARRRGQTIYLPDRRAPLHPPELSEGSASQLNGQDVPAVLWHVCLDQRGQIGDVSVERAVVRNHAARSYTDAQASLDAGHDDAQLQLLVEIGSLCQRAEEARGGVSLNLPEQSVVRDGTGVRLVEAPRLAVEEYNSQLSLACGRAAATLMLNAGCGILRTLPPPTPAVIDQLRVRSLALGVAWPAELSYAEWVRSLDVASDAGAALVNAAARTLRGAAYVAFDGSPPEQPLHGAIAAPYAHVTAPLRRLVDRYATECAVAASHGVRPPDWVLEALTSIPLVMEETSRRASETNRACVDLVEALLMEPLVGTTLAGTLISAGERDHGRGMVQFHDPIVILSVDGAAPEHVGQRVSCRIDAVDVAHRRVAATVVSGNAS
jgi:exoribonuclease R